MMNIPSTVADPMYRYKMPKMILKVEGKGNGIMTNITNLDDIAKALRVPLEYPLKFFGVELGSLTKVKGKSFIVNGKHEMVAMIKILDKFIEKYVLCPVCKLPEMTLKAKKDSLKGMCRSCGKMSKLDSTHKVAIYIMKNPPKDESEFKEETKKKKEHHKKKDKSKKETKPDEGKMENESIQELSVHSVEIRESIARVKDFKNAQTRTPSELLEQINNIAISQAFKEDIKYHVMLHSLFDENIMVELASQPNLEQTLKLAVEKDEEKGQMWLLLSLESFILRTYKHKLQEHTNSIMQKLFEDDILEEEVLLKCFGKSDGEEAKLPERLINAKTFSAELHSEFGNIITPFISWLNEAEEESGEEDQNFDKMEETKEDESVKRQKKLIEEQMKLQEMAGKEKSAEASSDAIPTSAINLLAIKPEAKAVSLDDL